MFDPQPSRIIDSLAPTRVCDNGGWTDTWFGSPGRVFNIAVLPGAHVRLRAYPRGGRPHITIHAEDYGDVYSIERPRGAYGRHPLLEAAFDYLPPDDALAVDVSIHSEAPPGASVGTSAAVTVALLGALDHLRGRRLTAHQLAAAAHEVETRLLGQQSGVQDQVAAAVGGINFIEIDEYPRTTVVAVRPTESTWRDLEARLALVFVGRPHFSSEVHERVIRDIEGAGPDHPPLRRLRQAAEAARDAVVRGDLEGLGAAMIENTRAQGDLHPSLIGPDHARVLAIARTQGATGWKVNGAGGDGGSVTLLCGEDPAAKQGLLRAVETADPGYRVLPIRLARRGLVVTDVNHSPK